MCVAKNRKYQLLRGGNLARPNCENDTNLHESFIAKASAESTSCQGDNTELRVRLIIS